MAKLRHHSLRSRNEPKIRITCHAYTQRRIVKWCEANGFDYWSGTSPKPWVTVEEKVSIMIVGEFAGRSMQTERDYRFCSDGELQRYFDREARYHPEAPKSEVYSIRVGSKTIFAADTHTLRRKLAVALKAKDE